MTRRLALGGVLVICAAAVPSAAAAPAASNSCPRVHWVAVWGSSPSDADDSTTLAGQTVRTILTPLGSGSRMRVRLSNRFGTAPLLIDSAFAGARAHGAAIRPGSNVALRFHGKRAVSIAAGGQVASDPADLSVRRSHQLAVSVHVSPLSTAHPTRHYAAMQTTYVAPPQAGQVAGEVAGAAFTGPGAGVTYSRPIVTGIDALAGGETGTVVAFGDSLTDGLQAPGQGFDDDARYPDFLARRLATSPERSSLSVVNAGISGNGFTPSYLTFFGPPALSRLRADVIDQAGASDVIVLIGRNDFDFTEPPQLIASLTRVVRRLERRHLNVILGTSSAAARPPVSPLDLDRDEERRALNRWVRRQRLVEEVADFDRALRKPGDGRVLRPRFASGDGPHLSAAGYREMARTIDLAALRGPRCASQ